MNEDELSKITFKNECQKSDRDLLMKKYVMPFVFRIFDVIMVIWGALYLLLYVVRPDNIIMLFMGIFLIGVIIGPNYHIRIIFKKLIEKTEYISFDSKTICINDNEMCNICEMIISNQFLFIYDAKKLIAIIKIPSNDIRNKILYYLKDTDLNFRINDSFFILGTYGWIRKIRRSR